MKIVLSKDRLVDSFFYISKISSKAKKAAFAPYKCVQFIFKEKTLTLYANNGLNMCKFIYGEVQEADNFSCLIEFALIDKLISLSKSSEISFSFDDTMVILQDGKSKYKIAYVPLDDFSHLFNSIELTAKNKIASLDYAVVRDIPGILSPAIPAQDAISHLKGVYFDGSFVATNQLSVAVCSCLDKEIKHPAFLTIESFGIMTSVFRGNVVTEDLYMNGNNIVAVAGEATFLLNLMSATFPNYKPIVDKVKAHAHKINILMEDFNVACMKLISFTDTDPLKKNKAKLTITSNSVTIEARADNKIGTEVILLTASNIPADKTIEFFVNLQHLKEFIPNFRKSEVMISFDDVHSEIGLSSDTILYVDGTIL